MSFNICFVLTIERRRPSRLSVLGVNVFGSSVNQNCFFLLADFLHTSLCCTDCAFQFRSSVYRRLNVVLKLSVGTDVVVDEIEHRRCHDIGIVSFCPALISFSFPGSHLGFDVDEQFNLSMRHFAPGLFWDMYMLAGESHAQCFFRIFCTHSIQPDIAFASWRLNADLCTTFYPATCIFKKLY